MRMRSCEGVADSAIRRDCEQRTRFVRGRMLRLPVGTPSAVGTGMTPNELRARTKRFAIGIVHFCSALPRDWIARTLGDQLLRSGSSVAANYRSACRGRSDREFCAKIGVVADEADETLFWLELLLEASAAIQGPEYGRLLQEADELTAIFTASHQTARSNLKAGNDAGKNASAPTRRESPDHQITKSPNHQIRDSYAASGGWYSGTPRRPGRGSRRSGRPRGRGGRRSRRRRGGCTRRCCDRDRQR